MVACTDTPLIDVNSNSIYNEPALSVKGKHRDETILICRKTL